MLVMFAGLALFVSCTNQSSQKKEDKSGGDVVLTVDELQSKGAEFVGKEVIVKGTVTHVCKEDGGRCFLMGKTEDASVRIEAGMIGSFTQDQVGNELEVKGIVQKVELDEEDLAELEQTSSGEHTLGENAPAMHDIDGGKHDSLNQAKKLQQMNQKIAESKEGSVPVYYLEGIELIQKK